MPHHITKSIQQKPPSIMGLTLLTKMIFLYRTYQDYFRLQLRLSAFRSYHLKSKVLSENCPCLRQKNFVGKFLAVKSPSNSCDVTTFSANVTSVKMLKLTFNVTFCTVLNILITYHMGQNVCKVNCRGEMLVLMNNFTNLFNFSSSFVIVLIFSEVSNVSQARLLQEIFSSF